MAAARLLALVWPLNVDHARPIGPKARVLEPLGPLLWAAQLSLLRNLQRTLVAALVQTL